MKQLLIILAVSTAAINANGTIYKQSGYDNMYQQMDSYFQNKYWTSSWDNFSGWFPDVLENDAPSRQTAREIIQKTCYSTAFDNLTAEKQQHSIGKLWESLFWDLHDDLEGIRDPSDIEYEAPINTDAIVTAIITFQIFCYAAYKKKKKKITLE